MRKKFCPFLSTKMKSYSGPGLRLLCRHITLQVENHFNLIGSQREQRTEYTLDTPIEFYPRTHSDVVSVHQLNVAHNWAYIYIYIIRIRIQVFMHQQNSAKSSMNISTKRIYLNSAFVIHRLFSISMHVYSMVFLFTLQLNIK